MRPAGEILWAGKVNILDVGRSQAGCDSERRVQSSWSSLAQPLKGLLIRGLAASLKRCPDTKPEIFASAKNLCLRLRCST
jgi:hypothetical protein